MPPETWAAAVSLLRRAERWSPPSFFLNEWRWGTDFHEPCKVALEAMLRAHGWEPAKPIGAGAWWAHPKAGRGPAPFVVALRTSFAALAGRTSLPGVEELPGRPLTSAQRRAIDPRPARVTAEQVTGSSPPASDPASSPAGEQTAEQVTAEDPLGMRARVDRRLRWEARMRPRVSRPPRSKGAT